jgi:hypothetical protein
MNVLNPTILQAIAFVLFLLALPLLSFGTVEEQEVLWYVGLAMIVIAGVLPPLGRFLGEEDDGDEEAEEADEAKEVDDDGGADADGDEQADDDDADARPEPSAGPVGPSTGATGREPNRARVEEQRDLAGDSDEEDKS